MNTLTLRPPLRKKLNRLKVKVSTLTYLGIDINELIDRPIVAIVGTRKPTPYGKQITEKIAAELARAGTIIVSGLAFGIDTIAHEACLKAGGTTIGVLPSGINNIYPASHRNIAKRIVKEGGALLSEYEADRQPLKIEFLERNRIIAALSDAVIVTEAAERSGSLNTAGHAESMNIPVFAVPGPVTSSLSGGTNHLLKTGCRMITEARDVLEFLNVKGIKNKVPIKGNTPEETLVMIKISEGMHDSALLQVQSGLETRKFQMAITMLELDGKIKADAVGNWHII